MAKKKKVYADKRVMRLICVKCRTLWKDCPCAAKDNNDAWIFVTKQELEHYKETGLIPDYKAELCRIDGDNTSALVPLIHPPEYKFIIEE